MTQRVFRILLIWLLVLLSAWVLEPYVVGLWWAARSPRVVTPRGNLSELEKTTIAVFRLASPSVVHVYSRAGSPMMMANGEYRLQTGSGVVWDQAGDIVTNNHVIAGGSDFGVRLTSGEFVAARLIGATQQYDLAVLRLIRPRAPSPPLAIGRSADLQVGQSVFAIGNPYGLDQTLTSGIVSALHRRLPESAQVEITDLIQTDAPINPGNSGGPLLDSAGRMIGLDTAILSESGASAGIGFAIPIDTINRVVPQLIKSGTVPTPGIGIVSANPAIAGELGVNGIIVMRVVPNSPAANAGLQGVDQQTGQIGDIILAVNGRPVNTVSELSASLEAIGIGHTATLSVERDGQNRTVRLPIVDISQL
jgi:2-alkenal reductase